MLLDYIEDLHKTLARSIEILHNSSGRLIKMLRIILEWEEQESVYRIRLQDFMEEITKRGAFAVRAKWKLRRDDRGFCTTRTYTIL